MQDEAIVARGRGLKKPYARITVAIDQITIRVDDKDNPEFWLEVIISVDKINEALQLVQLLGAKDSPSSI